MRKARIPGLASPNLSGMGVEAMLASGILQLLAQCLPSRSVPVEVVTGRRASFPQEFNELPKLLIFALVEVKWAPIGFSGATLLRQEIPSQEFANASHRLLLVVSSLPFRQDLARA